MNGRSQTVYHGSPERRLTIIRMHRIRRGCDRFNCNVLTAQNE